MKPFLKLSVLALVTAVCLPLSVQAHRQWMLPSATVLSGNDPWVTVDAAISNDLFYFEHFPMRLENLAVIAPDGSPAKAENLATGRYRSTFDVHLTQKGTWKIAMVNNTVSASWEENGAPKQWRGTADAFTKDVPANAANLKVSRMSSRNELFITSGKPTTTVLAPTGVGLEMAPVTHPNDLVVGEAATFAFLLDGKPAANLELTVIPGGIRYRDNLGEMKLVTDAEGRAKVTFTQPGMHWLNATFSEGGAPRREGQPPSGAAPSTLSPSQERPPAGGPRLDEQPAPGVQAPRGPRGPGGPGGNRPIAPGRRASYITTLEVLPQ